MPVENELLHYRTRFEVFPFEDVRPPAQMVKEVMWRWLLWKEGMKPHAEPLVRQGDEWEGMFFSSPVGWAEPTEDGSRLRTDVLSLSGDGSELWAFECDEKDARLRHRRWRTRVGVSADGADGTCVVSVRISNYLSARYVGPNPQVPVATVPNFVRWIVGDEGYQCCMGDTALSRTRIELTGQNFADFAACLLSEDRDLPLVLVTTDWNGDSPVGDVDALAETLLGMANVYVADWRDPSVRGAICGLFRRGEPSYAYRCGLGAVRIYQPHVDLGNEAASSEHRFFTAQRIYDLTQEGREGFLRVMAQSLARKHMRGKNDVLELSDIAWRRSRIEHDGLVQRLRDARSKMSQPVSADDRGLKEQVKQLRAALAERDEAIDAYEELLREAEVNLEAQWSQRDGGDDSHYRLNRAESRCRELEEELRARATLDEAIGRMDSIPTRLADLLGMVADFWPTRVVVLDEALKSAESFKGNLDEEWQILRACATTLWQLRFVDGSGSIADDFRLQTGYELAMTEGKLTKVDAKLMEQRKRAYRGGQIDITPHIKGKAKGEKNAFRVYFAFDDERRLVVFGHCGRHLDTAGTRRMHS